MKPEEVDYIIKQTLIEASLHHEEDRQRYYNGILTLANHAKYLEHQLKKIVTEINKNPL
jgi:hypothetical protein